MNAYEWDCERKASAVDALEAEVREGRRAEEFGRRRGDAATTTETETAARREREIVRLRGELSRQAQVIADAYRDEGTAIAAGVGDEPRAM